MAPGANAGEPATSEGTTTRNAGHGSNSARQERSSRDLYVSKACNECRRRKLRCDGHTPCHRCAGRSITCVYDRTSRKRNRVEEARGLDSRLSQMQTQLDNLANKMIPSPNSAQLVTPADNSPCDRHNKGDSPCKDSMDRLARFRGPTSSEFSFEVAASESPSIHSLSKGSTARDGEGFQINTLANSELLADPNPIAKLLLNDPIQEMNFNEITRLIHVFNNGPGRIYPVAETSDLLQTSERLVKVLDQAGKDKSMHNCILAAEELTSPATTTLKLVLANALTLENFQVNPLAQKHFESVRERLGSSFWALPDLRTIINWILVALLHFHLDEELQASRVTAHAARLCLEMGLNRKDAHRALQAPSDTVLATKLMWAVFVLDRRSSIHLGIPFVIQDSDLDATLAAPVQDTDAAYLKLVVGLSRIAGDACRLNSMLSDKALRITTNEIDYLNYQISQWQTQLPARFRVTLEDLRNKQMVQFADKPTLFMNVILLLRGNQVRNLIYRPVLYSSERILVHEPYALTAIEIAREALQILHELGSQTEILCSHPVFFKYFLVSAFSTVVLAIAKNPASGSSSQNGSGRSLAVDVEHDFYMALDLFKLSSLRSPPMLRLWKSISSLEPWAVQMGVPKRPDDIPVVPTPPAETSDSQYLAPPLDAAWLDNWAIENGMGPIGTVGSNVQLANELFPLLDPDTAFSASGFFDPALDPMSLGIDMTSSI